MIPPRKIWVNVYNPVKPESWDIHSTENNAVANSIGAPTHCYIHESTHSKDIGELVATLTESKRIIVSALTDIHRSNGFDKQVAFDMAKSHVHVKEIESLIQKHSSNT